jgi:hypothetical protein
VSTRRKWYQENEQVKNYSNSTRLKCQLKGRDTKEKISFTPIPHKKGPHANKDKGVVRKIKV